MKTLSQQLPDFYEYYENETQFYLRQVQYPQDLALLHNGCMSLMLFHSGS